MDNSPHAEEGNEPMEANPTAVELAQHKLTQGITLDRELGDARKSLSVLMNTRAVTFSQNERGRNYDGDKLVAFVWGKAPHEYSTMAAFIDAQTERNEGPAAQRAALFLWECIREQEAEVERIEAAIIKLLS